MADQLINIHKPVTICRASAGTGKTFTLAAYYVGLLLSGEDYRSILAITFTNKATAEMSERILGYLHAIAQGEERGFLARARQFMIRNTHASDEELGRRAEECFRHMLLDFDNVQVQTIDSFLQTLLSGLAGVLRMSAGLNTELDVDHVIQQSVDQLLTTDMTPDDRKIMEDYMQLKLDQEAHWDVRKSLCMMAKELYNESVQILDANGQICFDANAIRDRREALEKAWEDDADLKQLKAILATCNPEVYNKYTKAAYDRLMRSVEEPEKVSTKDRFRGVSDKYCNADEMAQATALAEKLNRTYNTLQLTIRFSRDIELMASLQRLIQRNLTEANCALLARTAGTLSKALCKGDADFILEKAGIRYKHVLIDEFQDTSQLQWDVIRRLLLDVLASEGHTLLIVGDIKQSIYRWRNGNWHIMERLAESGDWLESEINERFTSLTKNYRSREEVVRFNLSLFQHIFSHYETDDVKEQKLVEHIYDEGFSPERLEDFYQSKKKKGGYVQFRAFPNGKKEDLTYAMFDNMEHLLRQGASPADMMVLVRFNTDARLITDLHACLDPEAYPLLSQASFVSAESFVLEASRDVQLLMAGLRFVAREDAVSAKYIEMATEKPELIEQIHDRIYKKMPLYEAVSELVTLLLTDKNGQYKGTETAYVNSFLDRTRAYVSAYGSQLDDFITYWDDTLHIKPITSAQTGAIQILTVHTSKGLQAQTLFVPFCTWTKEADPRHPEKIWCEIAPELEKGQDFVPIQDGQDMADSAYNYAYKEEHLNMRIDNLNMLYVALTRAEDNLYISTFYPVKQDGKMGACNHVGLYVMNCIGADEFEVGIPVVRIHGSSGTQGSRDTEPIQAELWSSSAQVRFIQSQEGALYTSYGEESYRRVARMEEGTLCHEIFAHLHKADELDQVLDMFESSGEIRDKEQRKALKTLISSAWEGSPEMRDWFTAPWQLKLEEAIYIDHREVRPDRVMINPDTGEAIVLDYKFGQWEDDYIRQVSEYKEALRRMGYAPVRGYLWFARQNRLVEVYK